MKYKLYAVATALAFFKRKAESLKLKAFGKLSMAQLTRRLPQPLLHKAGASGFAMTGLVEGFYKLKAKGLKLKADQNSRALRQSHAIGSTGLAKRRLKQKAESFLKHKAESEKLKANQNSRALMQSRLQGSAGLVKRRLKQKAESFLKHKAESERLKANQNSIATKQSHAIRSAGSVKRRAGSMASADEGSFYLDFFEYFFHLRKKVLSHRGDERHQHKADVETSNIVNKQKTSVTTTPFNSPASGGHWTQTCMVRKWNVLRVVVELRKKQLTRRFFTTFRMTGFLEGSIGQRTPIRRKELSSNLRPNILMLLLIVVVVIGAKRTTAQSKALQIGDQVPAMVFGNVINTNQQSIKLSDENSKPTLLIFWNSGCRETQGSMADINSWKDEFAGGLQIISLAKEKESLVTKYLNQPPLYQKFNIPIVIGDTLLSQLFPHSIYPHVVWLAKDRWVQSITGIEEVTPENVSAFIKGKAIKGLQKVDRQDFKLGQSSLLNEKTNRYYSMVSPYLPGISPAYKVWIDSSTNTIHTQVVNFPAYQIYLMAFGKFLGIPPNQVVWEVANPNHYVYQKASGNHEAWKRQHAYSYESVWPASIPVQERLEKIRTDLNAALGLNVRMEKRDTSVWRLIKTGAIKPAIGGKAYNQMAPAVPIKVLQNAGLGVLLYEMNQQSDNLPVIDETGYKGTIDMELAFDKFTDIPQINQALAPYHLKFEKVKRPISFLVFQENINAP